jgi:hypothetical protein
VTTISCDGGACSGTVKPGVSVTLSATDADSGVAAIRYTLNGTDPTATTGTLYSGAFTLSSAATIKYRAVDQVGNLEAVKTTAVQVDSTAPTTAVTSPAAGDTVSGSVTIAADAADNTAVDHVDFLVDGNVVGTDTSAPYTLAWNSGSVADGSHAITSRAVDSAGNATTSAAVSVSVANTNLLKNPSLETATGSTPTCWLLGGYGTNTFTWTRTSDAHTGAFAEALNISSLTNGDRKLVSAQDTGTCAPTVTAGAKYTVTAWYKSPTGPRFMAYYRNSAGTWVYWAQSPQLPVSSTWTQRSWTTPAVPAGATALSVGPALVTTGSMTVDDLALYAAG